MKKIFYFTLAIVLSASCGKKTKGLPEASTEYPVETVSSSSADLSTTYPATIRGIQDVEIRPRVSGNITSILVKEGQNVRKGETLFIIDNTQYIEAVKSALAQIKVCQSNIATAKLTLENKKMLHAKNIISEYDLRTAENNLSSLEAQLASAKAQLGTAKENLSWCTVTSPANGVINMLPYKVGALVGPSMSSPFTIVSDVSKAHAYFSLTEKQLLKLSRTPEGGLKEALKLIPHVTLTLSDGTIYPEKGKIDAIGGVVDVNTGAVQVRATFNNPNHLLKSGSSGNISIPTIAKDIILIPQSATLEIQDKIFVYVVDKNNKVKSVEITIDSQNDGQNYVVTGGLHEGDKIVVEGIQSLKNDMQIKPITPAQANQNRKAAAEAIKAGELPL